MPNMKSLSLKGKNDRRKQKRQGDMLPIIPSGDKTCALILYRLFYAYWLIHLLDGSKQHFEDPRRLGVNYYCNFSFSFGMQETNLLFVLLI